MTQPFRTVGLLLQFMGCSVFILTARPYGGLAPTTAPEEVAACVEIAAIFSSLCFYAGSFLYPSIGTIVVAAMIGAGTGGLALLNAGLGLQSGNFVLTPFLAVLVLLGLTTNALTYVLVVRRKRLLS